MTEAQLIHRTREQMVDDIREKLGDELADVLSRSLGIRLTLGQVLTATQQRLDEG